MLGVTPSRCVCVSAAKVMRCIQCNLVVVVTVNKIVFL